MNTNARVGIKKKKRKLRVFCRSAFLSFYERMNDVTGGEKMKCVATRRRETQTN
jgi:hypothetical protein